MQVFTDVCFWFESHPVANWTVHNNTFSNLNYGPGRQTADVYVSACVPSMPNLSSGASRHQSVAAASAAGRLPLRFGVTRAGLCFPASRPGPPRHCCGGQFLFARGLGCRHLGCAGMAGVGLRPVEGGTLQVASGSVLVLGAARPARRPLLCGVLT